MTAIIRNAATTDARELSYLDMLYADAPKPRERFLWPVVSDPFTMKPIRWFDSWGEATDFVSANLGKVNLFVGEPKRRSA
jgi:hypothetical protein